MNWRTTKGRLLLLGAALLGTSTWVGCTVESEEPRPPTIRRPRLIPVGGHVRLDGKPLEGAIVIFLPSFSEGTHSTGETNAKGEYSLSTIYGPGSSVGDYRVAISLIISPDGKPVSQAQRSGNVVPPELLRGREIIPPRYSDLSKTEFHATILPSGPSNFDFDLEGPLLDPPIPSPSGELPRNP
ncbi:MAG: carboxypeptidase-like regulatory domain-containing protein [Isosphaeraceae bacterium]